MIRFPVVAGLLLAFPIVAHAQLGCGCNPQPMQFGMLSNFASYSSAAMSPCGAGGCGTVQPMAQYTGHVTVHQPVAQTCYHTVPVTEYQQVKQTVKKPVVETKWIEQPVTEYKPVVETRTVNVPTTNYQDVTEYKTVTKNSGYWTTTQTAAARPSACEYDNNPGFVGWMNRTGFQMRQAFTPQVSTQRQFVPQTCVQTVPVTRRVAVQGTKQVSYNVTRYEPQTTTRKVAVNSVRYEDHEVTAMHPVTVMRTVPIGSQMAFSPLLGGSQTALQPQPDTTIQARRNTTEPQRSANGARDEFDQNSNPNNPANQNRRSENTSKSWSVNLASRDNDFEYVEIPLPSPAPAKPTSPPAATRVGRWVARTPDATPTTPAHPASLTLVDTDK